jgi:para-aminobenzoate synthetase component 1
MKDIERLEEYKRGVYSGAIGFFTPDGEFDFNVVIRTAFCRKDGSFTYAAGSAITSDADPETEWQEILLKTAVLRNE